MNKTRFNKKRKIYKNIQKYTKRRTHTKRRRHRKRRRQTKKFSIRKTYHIGGAKSNEEAFQELNDAIPLLGTKYNSITIYKTDLTMKHINYNPYLGAYITNVKTAKDKKHVNIPQRILVTLNDNDYILIYKGKENNFTDNIVNKYVIIKDIDSIVYGVIETEEDLRKKNATSKPLTDQDLSDLAHSYGLTKSAIGD